MTPGNGSGIGYAGAALATVIALSGGASGQEPGYSAQHRMAAIGQPAQHRVDEISQPGQHRIIPISTEGQHRMFAISTDGQHRMASLGTEGQHRLASTGQPTIDYTIQSTAPITDTSAQTFTPQPPPTAHFVPPTPEVKIAEAPGQDYNQPLTITSQPSRPTYQQQTPRPSNTYANLEDAVAYSTPEQCRELFQVPEFASLAQQYGSSLAEAKNSYGPSATLTFLTKRFANPNFDGDARAVALDAAITSFDADSDTERLLVTFFALLARTQTQ
jgi:hypothetical protein